MLLDSDMTESVVTDGSGSWDVEVYDLGATTYKQIKLNTKGRFWLKVFEMLGYNLPIASQTPSDHALRFSALPILEFLRIFLDWYTPSQFQESNPINGIYNYFKNDFGSDQSGQFHLTWNSDDNGISLKSAISQFLLAVDNDYFTSAWMSPNSAGPYMSFNGSVAYSYDDNLNVRRQVVADSENVIEIQRTASTDSQSSLRSVSAFALDMLEKLQNFVTRNKLAGSRSLERILARFGVRVPDSTLRISEYIGSTSKNLDIMQVVSQGGEVQDLGSLAGRAIVSESSPKPFEYDVKEYGTFFVVASIEVKSTFVDGYSRSLKHLRPFDFYTPEFDGKTPQAISTYEVFSRLYSGSDHVQAEWNHFLQNSDGSERILGFCPRYAEYKFGRDHLTGDFLRKRFQLSVSDFELMRRVVHNVNDIERFGWYFDTNSPLDIAKILYQNDSAQYNRVFNVTSDTPDPFYFTFYFNVSAHRPMLPVNDQSELDGFKELEMDTNGTKMQ